MSRSAALVATSSRRAAPGQGVLFHDVGSISFSGGDVIVHGPHDIFEQGDAAFCNALIAVTP